MVSDPAGYFVIIIDRVRRLLNIGHYQNNGVLTTVIEGHSAAEVYMTAIERELLTRLNHAAYLGRELARAEHQECAPLSVCDLSGSRGRVGFSLYCKSSRGSTAQGRRVMSALPPK